MDSVTNQSNGLRNITDTTSCLVFATTAIGLTRKITPGDVVEDGVNLAPLRVSKTLLDVKEVSAIVQHVQKTRAWLKVIALPSILKAGVYLLPDALIVEVDEQMEAKRVEWEALLEKLFAAYPKLVEADKEKLGERLYDPADYPTIQRLKRAYTWETRWLAFKTPAKLASINSALNQRERAKAARDLESFTSDVKALLRAQMRDLVGHMVDRLTVAEDGKKRIFKASSVEKLGEFLRTVDLRNVAGDAEVGTLAAQARDLLDGVDPKLLRDDDGVRDAVRGGFDNIKTALDKLVAEAPSRLMDFSE